jgi:peptide/nickel transport system permease protein
MFTYALRRIGMAVLLTLLVGTLVFAFLHLLPGDPAVLILSAGGGSGAPSTEQVVALRHELGLDLPVGTQYTRWMAGVLTLRLGHSLVNDTSVRADIAQRSPASLEVIVAAVLLAVAAGIPLGILAAQHRGSWVDGAASTMVAAGISAPVFVVGTLLVLVFGVRLRWLPTGGYVPFAADPAAHLRLLILPAVALAFNLLGTVGRITRGSVLEVLGQDYVRAAWAKGLHRRRVFYRHVLRTALIPIVTVVGLQFGSLIGRTVLVEYVFTWPGISTLLFTAIQERDYPVVQGIVLAVSLLFIVINLAVDLSYAWLDPRIRYERGAS